MSINSSQKSHISKHNFEFGSWKISVQKSHILQSRCTNSVACISHVGNNIELLLCDFCKYERELELPQLPEMTFASNILKLEHEKGFSIKFNALDALKMVDSKNDVMKVAVAEAWHDSRGDNPCIKEVVKPFDWTFSTDYKGTLNGDHLLKIYPTEERINIEKLKVKAKILFYEDIILFEDELADNGVAQLSVKIRVMPDSFFVLLRYFLRVDNLMVRIIDTRVYFEENTNYLLREHMTKEGKVKDLKVPQSFLRNPQELWDHLPTVKFEFERVEFEQ